MINLFAFYKSVCDGNECGLLDAEIALKSIERAARLHDQNGQEEKTLYKPVEGDNEEKTCHAERY